MNESRVSNLGIHVTATNNHLRNLSRHLVRSALRIDKRKKRGCIAQGLRLDAMLGQ